MEVKLFEQASKQKLRFNVKGRGVVSTEDLWDLSLEELDTLAKKLNSDLKEANEESFIKPYSSKNATLELQFDITKRVINVKLLERDEAKAAMERKAKKEKIMAAIARKQDEAIDNKSLEELHAELDSL